MSITKNIKYPVVETNQRVFYDFDKFTSFFRKNQNEIKAIKINPPKIGSKNFGSVKVKLKKI